MVDNDRQVFLRGVVPGTSAVGDEDQLRVENVLPDDLLGSLKALEDGLQFLLAHPFHAGLVEVAEAAFEE